MPQMMHPGDVSRALRQTVALVLAGGRGSRLRDLTDKESKPAMPFGGKFRIVDFPLSNCLNAGIRRVGVLTQYRSQTLIQHIQRGWGFLRAELNEFIEVWPAQQQTDDETWYKGTADAVFQNLDLLREHSPEYVLVLAGDHVYRQDYGAFLAAHMGSGADVSVCCMEVSKNQAHAFGVVAVDEADSIIAFQEKPADPPTVPGKPAVSFASMGIYVFNASVLFDQLERDAREAASSHDFGKDLIPFLVGKVNLKAHRFEQSCVRSAHDHGAYWRDVGTIDAFWEANLDLTSITPELDLYDPAWPIWTYQPQLPPAKFVFDQDGRRGMAVDSLVSGGCVVSGSTVRRCLLYSSVRVNSYALVEDSVLLPGAHVGRHARLRKALVAADCTIPPNLVVGEDAEADARRFHRSEGGVALITQAMLDALNF